MSSSPKVIVSLLRKYLKPYIPQVILLTIFLMIGNSIEIINPQIVSYYIDSVIEGFDQRIALFAGLMYIGMSFLQRSLMIVIRYFSQNLGWASTNDLRSDLTRHCMHLDMTFHNKYKPGEMIERIDGDATALSQFFSTFTIYFIGSFLVLIGIIVATFVEGWIYGVIFTGFTIVSLVGLYFIRKIVSPLWKKVRESTTALFGNIEESLSSLEDVKANGGDEYVMKKFHDISRIDFQNKNKAMIVSRIYYLANIIMNAVLTMLILVACYYLYIPLGLTAGTVFLLLTYASNILRPLRLILAQLEALQNTLANIERINEFFNIETEINDNGTESFPTESIELKFKDLNFSYNKEDMVLQNISFHLQQGKKIGLIGHTGSGKTTLARLIFRLYDPTDGSITINGINSQEFPLKELRQNIAYVTQEVELFKASVKDNITFFSDEIPEEVIRSVFEDIGLEEWTNKLPNGLDTKVFSDELGLSAGEEQLLALSRAFLKDPKIVILDEASSRLDPATERKVDTAISKLLEGRSAIIIAHRLTTLHDVDDILLLKDGHIIEYDSRENLLKDPNSHFSQLLQKGIEEVLQ